MVAWLWIGSIPMNNLPKGDAGVMAGMGLGDGWSRGKVEDFTLDYGYLWALLN